MRTKSRIRPCVLACVTAIMLGSPSLGWAHDHAPPEATLRTQAGGTQEGRLNAYCWVVNVDPATGDYTQECVDAPTEYPSPVRVSSPERVRIRLHKPTRPELVVLRSSRTADGDERRLPILLKPVKDAADVVAWDVVFDVCHARRHYYLRLGAVWPDEEGAQDADGNPPSQDAIWTFHVRTRR